MKKSIQWEGLTAVWATQCFLQAAPKLMEEANMVTEIKADC
ncbi:hypothetical protein Q2941_41030 [Bradyrhizobium sp. UFLA05-153]